jgi:hypothetical protein
MSDEALPQEAPQKPIEATFRWGERGITYSAHGVSAGSLAELARLLGVDVDLLVPKVDPDEWLAEQRRSRRIKSRVVPSSFPW